MRLRLAAFLLTLALGLLAAPPPAEAQKARKVYRIGFLMGASRPIAAPYAEVFLRQLRDLGWVEGENFVMEYRFAEGKFERFPALAADLVQLKVDVIVAASKGISAAMNATKTIPIVMAVISDPVKLGVVASLARPGGNITGLSLLLPEIVGKQLELLKEVVPDALRVAVLWNAAVSSQHPTLREAKVAARALGVQLQVLEVGGPDDFDSAFRAMTEEHADALLVTADAMFFLHRKRIAHLAAKHRLPAMYGLPGQAKPGGLMAYAPNLFDLFRRSAFFVDKILKGAKPADLPVEQPREFELVINLRTAKALGLTIPDSILIRADQLIE